MSTFKNEFSWSISRDRVFQTCPRQYYFNYYGYWGGWEINAPQRVKQIYVLKQLKNRYMWAGAKVHDFIERLVEAPGEIKSNTELMAQAENLGKNWRVREHYSKERYNGNK